MRSRSGSVGEEGPDEKSSSAGSARARPAQAPRGAVRRPRTVTRWGQVGRRTAAARLEQGEQPVTNGEYGHGAPRSGAHVAGVSADVAGVRHDPGAAVSSALFPNAVPASRLRSASLLKPLLAWAAVSPTSAGEAAGARPGTAREAAGAGLGDAEQHALLWRAIALSDNSACDQLVAVRGLEMTLVQLAHLSDVTFEPGTTWGQVPVRARQVAAAYRELALCAETGDPVASAVISAMHDVPAAQRLGVDEVWATVIGCPPVQVGIKLGWDLAPDQQTLHTHAVVMDPRHTGVVLTAAQIPGQVAHRWRVLLDREGPEAVLTLHDEVAGDTLRWAARLAAAGSQRST